MTIYLNGLLLGWGLIVAIGAQNLYVLKMGVANRHAFSVAALCSITDAFLITLGVAGLGTLIAQNEIAVKIAAFGGGAFLIWFGSRALWAAVKGHSDLQIENSEDAKGDFRKVMLTALGFSLLNPHVYLDTVVFLGTLAAQYPDDDRVTFGLGAVTASLTWFFALAYGAKKLAPLFIKPKAARLLDLFVAIVMLTIAAQLISDQII